VAINGKERHVWEDGKRTGGGPEERDIVTRESVAVFGSQTSGLKRLKTRRWWTHNSQAYPTESISDFRDPVSSAQFSAIHTMQTSRQRGSGVFPASNDVN